MVQELRALATRRPLLAVVEDLHWVDTSSAQLLRHLCATLVNAHLLLVVTRRPGPGATAASMDAVEALTRRSSARIDLKGIDADAAAALLRAATGQVPDPDEVAAHAPPRLRATRSSSWSSLGCIHRAMCRPRWAKSWPGGLTPFLWPHGNCCALRQYSARRLIRGCWRSSISTAEEEALAVLEPALELQMIRSEPDPDTFSFSHALVRDAVYASVPPTHRARLHAAVADALDVAAPRQNRVAASTSAAWHWLAAGPRWANRAWPAAVAAAKDAMALHGYEEAAALLKSALRAADQDPGCTQEHRYGVLLDWLRACVAAGDRIAVQQVAEMAVDQAWKLPDPRRAAVAAVTSADGAFWALRPYGVVNDDMVRTLERALRELPAADQQLRCRVLLVLAAELYYADAPRERQALVDEGLAMARRLGDDALLAWACLTAPIGIWRPGTASIRHSLADEAVTAARRAGSQTMLADALARRAGAALELGRVPDIHADETAARRIADRLQLAYPLIAA